MKLTAKRLTIEIDGLYLWAIIDEHGNTMYQVYSKINPLI